VDNPSTYVGLDAHKNRVAVAMLVSMTVAATIGAVEPFVFQRFGIDPATATGPLITTTTDLIATFAYLALATIILL
jgi:magnesium transporter